MATKIGLYFDQSSIGGGLDLEELADGVTSKWGDFIAVSKVFPVLSATAALSEIRKNIEEEELDGLVLCGSSPRVDWDIYTFPGLEVERVNLREQCVLSYKNPDGSVLGTNLETGDAPELLVAMTTDYINMGIVKIQKSMPPVEVTFEAERRVLVLGGGWTGLMAARHVAQAGYEVVLVEKESRLGGRVLNFHKTIPLKYPHEEAHDTGLEKLVDSVRALKNITIYEMAELQKLDGAPGEFIASVKLADGVQDIKAGAVVLATGWQPMGEKLLAPFGYKKIPNILTSAEFEKMVKEGGEIPRRVAFLVTTGLVDPAPVTGDCTCATEIPADAATAANENVSQDVSQEATPETAIPTFTDLESNRHLTMSNAITSVVALKQAGYVCDAHSGGQAFILYDNMVVQGIHERFYKAAQNRLGIMMSKANIEKIVANDDNSIGVYCSDTLLGDNIQIDVDMVVLPTGIVPSTAKSAIVNLQYRQGQTLPDLDLFTGFADSNYICFPYETRRTGIYAAGCVRQPMTLDSATEDAAGAALKAIQCIESAGRGMSVHPRSGDLSYPVFNFVRCTQCKRCTEECPFGALEDDEKGTPKPNPSRCRRCGTCMGACPERVISFANYNVDQIGSMVREVQVPPDMKKGGPRVIIFACENDAYPALDMAALRGKHWSPYVRIIPVRCLGSLNAIWVADAMAKGIDGVMLLGCKYGDDYQCHFVKGSEICSKRKANIAESLDRLGIEPDRVQQNETAIDEYDMLPQQIEQFVEMIFEKGPNPFKGY